MELCKIHWHGRRPPMMRKEVRTQKKRAMVAKGGCGYRKYDRGQQKPVQRLSDPIEENGYVEANDN